MDTLDAIVSGEFPKVGVLNGMWTIHKPVVAPIVCADGVTLSVQATNSHYCTPRTDYGPYSAVEVGYPSARPPGEWERYFDGEWQRSGNTWGSLRRIWAARKDIGRSFRWGVESELKRLKVGWKWIKSGFIMTMQLPIKYKHRIARNTIIIAIRSMQKEHGQWMMFKHWTSLVDNACDGVYGFVPVELVRDFIDGHGGEFKWHLM